MASLSVLVSFKIAGHPIDKTALISAAIMFIIVAALFVLDDVFDVRVDTLNNPSKPLPSGLISMAAGWTLGFCLLWSGVWVTFETLEAAIFRIIIGVCLMGTCYPAIKFRAPIVGNVIVAVMCCSCFIFGPTATHNWDIRTFAVLGIVFFYFWGREVGKEIPQISGDKAVGMQTIPIRYGVKKACQLAIGLVSISIAINIGYLGSKIASSHDLATSMSGITLVVVWCLSLWQFSRYLVSPTQESINGFLKSSGAVLPFAIVGFAI